MCRQSFIVVYEYGLDFIKFFFFLVYSSDIGLLQLIDKKKSHLLLTDGD